MSSNSVIDQKREEINNQNDPSNKQLALVKKMANQLVHLGFIIIVGTCSLYTCRAVQANLLPTLIDCAPYTRIWPHIAIPKTNQQFAVETNVNIVGGDASIKMEFPIVENLNIMTNAGFLSWLRNCIDGPKSSQFSYYFSSIMQSMLVFNFSGISRVYQIFNTFLPETLIILLLPYVVSFIYFALAFLDGFYFIYLWFAKLPAFCSEKQDGEWKKTSSIFQFWNWWKILIALILLLFGVSTFISVPFIIVAVAYTFFFPLTLKSQVQSDGDKPKKYGPMSLFKDVLKFKRNIFMYIIALLLLNNTSTLFGAAEATSVVIVCIALYFFTGIFHQYKPTAADGVTEGLASFEQIEKTCGEGNEVPIADFTDSPPVPSAPYLPTYSSNQDETRTQIAPHTYDKNPGPQASNNGESKIFTPNAQRRGAIMSNPSAPPSFQTLKSAVGPESRENLDARNGESTGKVGQVAMGSNIRDVQKVESTLVGGSWKNRSRKSRI